MTEVRKKAINGRVFVEALQDAGLLPPLTKSVVIEAHIDKVPTVTYTVVGDERLLEIVDGIDDSETSIAK